MSVGHILVIFGGGEVERKFTACLLEGDDSVQVSSKMLHR